ncbi:hypothetical protein [Megalodesulfovibrio paquesii]
MSIRPSLLSALCTVVLLCSTAVVTNAADIAPLPVQDFHLEGPATDASMEFSSLSWWEDRLVLLPQYPERAGGLFFIKKSSLLERLAPDGALQAPVIPVPWSFADGGLAKSIPGYEGYEAIAFDGDTVYAAIEARHQKRMVGWLVRGKVDRAANRIIMDPVSKVRLDPPAQLRNMAFEALLVREHKVYAFFEANGRNVNPRAQVLVFSPALVLEERIGFPALEYRFTDVTAPDEDGGFYGLNFFWTGEAALLRPASETPGQPANNATTVERLLPLRFSENGIEKNGPDLPLARGLLPSNWEGIARLEAPELGLHGVMIVTDKYPATRLGFVALPTAP